MRSVVNARPTQVVEKPRFYSVAEASRICRVSAMTLYRAIAAEEFPAVRIRERWIIPAKVIDAMIEMACERGGAVDAAEFVTKGAA